jgi:hypothetical protein
VCVWRHELALQRDQCTSNDVRLTQVELIGESLEPAALIGDEINLKWYGLH